MWQYYLYVKGVRRQSELCPIETKYDVFLTGWGTKLGTLFDAQNVSSSRLPQTPSPLRVSQGCRLEFIGRLLLREFLGREILDAFNRGIVSVARPVAEEDDLARAHVPPLLRKQAYNRDCWEAAEIRVQHRVVECSRLRSAPSACQQCARVE